MEGLIGYTFNRIASSSSSLQSDRVGGQHLKSNSRVISESFAHGGLTSPITGAKVASRSGVPKEF